MSQHSLLKDLLKVLQKEDDVVMVTTALLDLVALLPAVPSNVDKCLYEVFDVFRDIARWRTAQSVGGGDSQLPEIQVAHVQVALFALFHRLYGMFPCNFLSYLRTQYSDNSADKSEAADTRTGSKVKRSHVTTLRLIQRVFL